MSQTIRLVVLLIVAVSAAGPSFDLLQLEHKESKGRAQDQASDPIIASILASGKEAIPVLIELVESERVYSHSPIDYWPQVHEGDMALVILCDLFLDPTWKKSTLPELCWDNVLERSDARIPAWELLGRYVDSYGRRALADKWKAAWLKHRDDIMWDEEGRYFRVVGQELVACG